LLNVVLVQVLTHEVSNNIGTYNVHALSQVSTYYNAFSEDVREHVFAYHLRWPLHILVRQLVVSFYCQTILLKETTINFYYE